MDYPVGRSFDPFSFVIDYAKVQELCFALRDANPIYRDEAAARAAGLAGIPVPPTFLNSSIQTLILGVNPVDALGISRRRALHAGQDYELLGTLYVGDRLVGQTRLADATRKLGRSGTVDFLTLETSFRRDGRLVAIVRNRVAVRGVDPAAPSQSAP